MKSIVSYRIETNTWLSEKHFTDLLVQVKKHRKDIDEISLFLNWTHSSMPLDYIENQCIILKDRLKKIKELNIKAGINHLTTIGHHRENDAGSLKGDYQRHIFFNGETGGDLCIEDENVINYIKKTYELIAKAHPDYIWMDDDVGMTHHYNCFCSICLNKFNKIYNFDYNRESLISQMDNDFDLREKWYKFYTGKVNKIIKIIRNSIDTIDKNIVLGLMSADYDYEDTDKKLQSDILSRNGEIETKWRPGCGVYKDQNITEWYTKAQLIGRLTKDYPKYVTNVQSEIENFPYNHLQKSVKYNLVETCGYIGAGCTGVAYNVLMGTSPLSDYSVKEENQRRFYILKYKPFYDKIVQAMGREQNKGIYFVQKDKSSLWKGESAKRFISPDRIDKPAEMFFNGLPQAYKESNVTVLEGNEVYNLTDTEIMSVLKGGVFLNGEALNILCKLGYGEYLGFETDKIIERDGIEKFNSHNINKGFNNVLRDCRMSFWRDGLVYTFKKTHESAEYLSSLVNYEDDTFGYCSGIYENKLGGRVCVMGYYPNMYVQNYSQSVRLKRIFRYLSKNTLNYISSYHNIIMFERGKGILIISNSLDNQENVELALQGNISKINILNQNMEERTIIKNKFEDNYSFFTFDMQPFDIILINK